MKDTRKDKKRRISIRFWVFLGLMMAVNITLLIIRLSNGHQLQAIFENLALIDIFMLFVYFGYFLGLRPMLDGMSSSNPERRQHSMAMFGGSLFALGDAKRRQEERKKGDSEPPND